MQTISSFIELLLFLGDRKTSQEKRTIKLGCARIAEQVAQRFTFEFLRTLATCERQKSLGASFSPLKKHSRIAHRKTRIEIFSQGYSSDKSYSSPRSMPGTLEGSSLTNSKLVESYCHIQKK